MQLPVQLSSEASDQTSRVAAGQSEITPGKLLDQISPIRILKQVESARMKSRASAEMSNSPLNIVNIRRNLPNKTIQSGKSGAIAKKNVNGKNITKGATIEKRKIKQVGNEKMLCLTLNPTLR